MEPRSSSLSETREKIRVVSEERNRLREVHCRPFHAEGAQRPTIRSFFDDSRTPKRYRGFHSLTDKLLGLHGLVSRERVIL